MHLYPSVLTDSLTEYEAEVAVAASSPEIEVVQVDIIDGYFVDNVTVSPLDLTQVAYGALQLDFHLMVEEPMDFVHELIGIAQYLPIRAVIAQVERMSFQTEFLEEVRVNQWKTGLSLNLHTPVSAIDSSSWEQLDVVQIMAVEAGAQNQEFQAQVLEKIPAIRAQAPHAELIIDGGVKESHIPLLKKNGVDSIVVGSGIWNPQAAIEHFSKLVDTE